MITRVSLRGLVIGAATLLIAGSAFAQQSATVNAQMMPTGVPTGPSTACQFKLYCNPMPWSLAGCGVRVWYNNTQIVMQGAGFQGLPLAPNLGCAVGPETADTTTYPGVTNVYRNYVMDWLPSLFNPSYDPFSTWNGDMLQLNFITTAGFSGPASSILVYVNAQPGSDMIDENLASITDTYANASAPFSCPVTVSGFSID